MRAPPRHPSPLQRRRSHSVGAAALALFATLGGAGAAAAAEVELPRPEGPHPVGYTTRVLPTSQPDELSAAAGDTRTLLLEIWFPAVRVGAPKPFSGAAVASALAEDFPFPAGFERGVSTGAHLDAVAAVGRHPVVVFSHGLSWPVALYQSLLAELASHGYVVIGVNHPHGTFVDYGGERGVLDRSAWPRIDDEALRQEHLGRHVAVWRLDLENVLAALPRWQEEAAASPVAGHLDLDRVGLLGHSYGGTAVGGLTAHPRVDAVVAMEGRVRPDEAAPVTVESPFLHLIGGYNRLELEGDAYLPSAGAPVYQAVVEGTGHAYFSDLLELYRHWADADWHRRHRYEVAPARVLQIASDYLVAFFDRYLRGVPASVLLVPRSLADRVAGPSRGGYPEVDLTVRVP